MKQLTYKLKKKRLGNWELPIKDILVNRIKNGEDLGGKNIKYVPGAKSIWADDLPENAISTKKWFSKGFLFVSASDKNLIEILNIHPLLGKEFALQDKEAEARIELEAEKAKDEIINLISNSDSERIIATSMAVFGQSALTLTEPELELKLRKFAKEKPVKLLAELKSKTYQSKYIAALSVGKGVVRTNFGKTSVIWNNETEGEILKLARGENAIEKLGEFLSRRTEESDILLHALQTEIDKKTIKLPKEPETDKDAEIEKLKAELLKAKSNKKDDSALEELQAQYIELYKVEQVPARFKNDESWLQKKIDEKLSE